MTDIDALAEEIRSDGELDELRALGLLDDIVELRKRLDEAISENERLRGLVNTIPTRDPFGADAISKAKAERDEARAGCRLLQTELRIVSAYLAGKK